MSDTPVTTTATKQTKSFEEAFAALEELTRAIGENEAALERRSAVQEFAKDNELKLTNAQKQRVESEILLQQQLTDNQAFEERAADLQKESELLQLTSREAEVRAVIYEAERDSLLGLNDQQRARIRNLIEEQQAIQDGQILQDRLAGLSLIHI